MNKSQLWDLVNNANTINDVAIAESEIENYGIDNESYDELMRALSYISREIYHEMRKSS